MIPGSALPLLLATTGGGINPRSYFDVKLYTGNGSTQTISGLGFSPDLVWIKSRSVVQSHVLTDAVRGTSSQLFSNLTDAQGSQTDQVTALNSDGFSLGANVAGTGGVNTNTQPYVAWTWDAGSSTDTNTDGSITSTVRANPSAGFSVITYTGNLSGAGVSTVGHGLGAAPSMVITKRRDGISNWCVQHISTSTASQILFLDTTDAQFNTLSNGTLARPTSTVFSVNNSTGLGVNGQTHVAYCFAPVAGYSSFGTYTGNGSASGPIISGLGFTPYFVMIKASSTTGDWWMYDGARSTTNPRINKLKANSSNAEDTAGEDVDFQSDGFQIKTADIGLNQNAATYIYAAFA